MMRANVNRMTSADRKIARQNFRNECHKIILEEDEKYDKEVDAMILYTLHTELGFGKERIMRFFRAMDRNHKALKEDYLFSTPDEMAWLYKYKLKNEVGIDIDEVYEEMNR